jgi:hypothetical protein
MDGHNSGDKMKPKSIKVYRGQPIEKMINRLRHDQTVTGRVNSIVERYFDIIDSDTPGPTAEKWAELEKDTSE